MMIYVNWTDARCARCGANVASIDHLRKHQRECNDQEGSQRALAKLVAQLGAADEGRVESEGEGDDRA